MKTVKIDKWKELLQQAEAAHSKRVTQLESLQQEQVRWLRFGCPSVCGEWKQRECTSLA